MSIVLTLSVLIIPPIFLPKHTCVALRCVETCRVWTLINFSWSFLWDCVVTPSLSVVAPVITYCSYFSGHRQFMKPWFEPPVKNNGKTSDKVAEAVRTAFSCRFPWNKKVSLLIITSNWPDAGSWVACLRNISRFQNMCIITVNHTFILVLLWFVSHWLNQYGTENFVNTHVKDITLLSVVKKKRVNIWMCFLLAVLTWSICCWPYVASRTVNQLFCLWFGGKYGSNWCRRILNLWFVVKWKGLKDAGTSWLLTEVCLLWIPDRGLSCKDLLCFF